MGLLFAMPSWGRHRRSVPYLALWSLALLGLLAPSLAHAQSAGVTMKVSPTAVVEGEDVTVELTFRGNYDKYLLPDLTDFKTVGQQQSSQVTIMNGDVKRTLNLTLRVLPKRAGILTIGSPKLYRSGKMVATAPPRSVRVRKQAPLDPNSSANSSAGVLQKLAGSTAVFMHGSISRGSVFVGEIVPLNWEVFVGSDYRLEDFTAQSRPALEGFLTEEVPAANPRNRLSTRQTTIGNRKFTAYRTSTQLLTPLKPGRLVIDAFSADIAYGQRRSFGRSRKTIRSRPYFVEVKPLPQGAPKAFDPANVGKFQMSVSLRNAQNTEPRNIQTGQRMVLKVVVTGEGNIGGLANPVVDDVDGRFEIHTLPTGKNDTLEKSASGVTGKREFEFLVTALKPGEYETPTVRLAYFDPTTASYQTAVGKGRPVKVTGSELSDGQGAAVGTAGVEGAADIGPIVEGVALSHHSRSAFPTTYLFWILVALPVVGFGAVEIRFRRQRNLAKDPSGRRSKGAVANARKRLGAAERALKDDLVKDFYGQIARTLTNFFEERAQLPATGMTHDALREAAIEVGYPAELLDSVVTELENCDFARFAPSASANKDMREALGRVQNLIGKLASIKPRSLGEAS